MDLKENTKYIVVDFVKYTSTKGIKSVDLVPRSWLLKKCNQYYCKYPEPDDYDKIMKWTKEMKIPELHWDEVEVTILKEAANYKQGMRRLKRSFSQREIETSEIENEAINNAQEDASSSIKETPVVLDVSEKDRMLSDISHITLDSSSSNKLLRGKIKKHGQESVSAEKINYDNCCDLSKHLKDIEHRLLQKISSAKKSILYDIDKKLQEIKNIIQIRELGPSLAENIEILQTDFPITTVQHFIAFDNSLKDDQQKQKALKSIIAIHSCATTAKDAVSRTLKALICKDVQQAYSAYGRKIKGVGKNNFSATYTFTCLYSVLNEKFKISKSEILSLISRWLSGAVDRDGGKAQRIQKEID